MAGNKRVGLVVQERDRRLLSELGVMRILDRESAKLVAGGAEHDLIDVDAPVATQASLAIAWSPKWRASLDGKAVPLTESPEGLLQVAIPAGRHRLEVRFQRDFADYAGLAISLATLLGLVAYVARRWRGRRPVPKGAAQGPAEAAGQVDRGS